MKKNIKEKKYENRQENADEKIMLDKILDGTVVKKEKNSIYLMPKKGSKKIKVSFTPETSFLEMILSKSGKIVSQTQIKSSELKEKDNLSLVIDKDKENYIAFIVRKIIVNF